MVHSFTASTTDVHILDGKAVWLLVINQETGEARFGVIGAGERHIRSIDVLNNPLAAVVWDTKIEVLAKLLENYREYNARYPRSLACT